MESENVSIEGLMEKLTKTMLSDGKANPEDLAKELRKKARQSDEPDSTHLSFIPQVLRSPVLLMKAQPLQMKQMATVFLGTIRINYTEDMCKQDIEQWKLTFGNQTYFEIVILPMLSSTGDVKDQVNGRDAIPKIEEALKGLNHLPDHEYIRIVCLGTGYSKFLYESITFLLKNWQKPDGTIRSEKHLQFVTSGDTKKNDLCNFSRWLCVSGICATVEFYNTREYHPFGFCAEAYE
jgi:hypothetical protein